MITFMKNKVSGAERFEVFLLYVYPSTQYKRDDEDMRSEFIRYHLHQLKLIFFLVWIPGIVFFITGLTLGLVSENMDKGENILMIGGTIILVALLFHLIGI